jgi:hypothetical protein
MVRIMASIGLALVLAINLGAGAVQEPVQPSPAVGTGVIAGTVVDAVTGDGVSYAVVTAVPVPGPPRIIDGQPAPVPSVRSVADSAGRFSLIAHAGLFGFWVTRAGYADSHSLSLPQPLTVDLPSGKTMSGLVLRVWQAAAIGGQVVEENGQPIVDRQVMALRAVVSAGRRALSITGRSTRADERGEYRIEDLAPGTYALVLVSSAGRVPWPSPDGLPPQSPAVRLAVPPRYAAAHEPTVFLPDVLASSTAMLFDLGAGQERSGVDFRVAHRPGFSVSGMVNGRVPGDARPVELWLQPANADRIPNEVDQRRVVADPRCRRPRRR